MTNINLYQEVNDKIADLLLGCEDSGMCLYAGTYIKDIEKRLKEYKDLEEQGKLLKLPCAMGTIAYRINKGARKKLIPMRVQDVKIFQVEGISSMKIGCVEDIYGGEYNFLVEEIGKTVFLTRGEAEVALEKV